MPLKSPGDLELTNYTQLPCQQKNNANPTAYLKAKKDNVKHSDSKLCSNLTAFTIIEMVSLQPPANILN
jgi:hypothetical protein